MRRHFELVSRGDAKGAAALYAPNSLNHGRIVDSDHMALIMESIVRLREQFTIHEIIAEGDWVAFRATVTGKYETQPKIPMDGGIYSLANPGGQTYTFQHMHLFRIVDGQIAEHWANRDDLGAARQLGLELATVQNKTTAS